MLSRILAILSVSLILSWTVDGAPAVAKARQFLPSIPGYIPVYIRTGDTPLEEINPDLAEAFTSYSLKHGRLAFSRSSNEIEKNSDTIAKKSDDENLDSLSQEEKDHRYRYIQKIPRP